MRHLIIKTNLRKVRRVVRGSARRQDSVRAGLEALEKEVEFVAVHDAARPLITSREIERVFAAARKHGAAALAAPITDALMLGDVNHRVIGSIGRQNIFAMQTPQIFRRELLIQAHEQVSNDSLTVTDEVSTIEHAGGKVVIVPAEDHNFKITFARDLPVAECILKQRASSVKTLDQRLFSPGAQRGEIGGRRCSSLVWDRGSGSALPAPRSLRLSPSSWPMFC
jgi:2-C-methyl-D-erythritol 4-phosphate cytidylyltransferase